MFFRYLTARTLCSCWLGGGLTLCAITSRPYSSTSACKGKNILLFALKIFHYPPSNLDPGAVCQQDGEREAVYQAEAPLLAVDADVADEVVAAPEHALPLRHEVVLVAII